MKKLTTLLIAIGMTAANAAPSVALIATRGHVSATQQSAPSVTKGVACFWQVPREQRWYNVSHISLVQVVQNTYGRWSLQVWINGRIYDHEIPKGMDTQEWPNEILQKAKDC